MATHIGLRLYGFIIPFQYQLCEPILHRLELSQQNSFKGDISKLKRLVSKHFLNLKSITWLVRKLPYVSYSRLPEVT